MGSINRNFTGITGQQSTLSFPENVVNVINGFPWVLNVMFLLLLLFMLLFVCKTIIVRHKFILKNNINKVDDIAINIASVTPSLDEVILLEEKALVYLEDIKRAFSSRFNCEIRSMACGSIPERFSVPIVKDWFGNGIRKRGQFDLWSHALFSDQDFLIEPSLLTASYSAQSDTIEIVQNESFIEEGYAKLRVNRCMSRRFNLKEGFLSTDTIKNLAKRCIKPITPFPGEVCVCYQVSKFLSCLEKRVNIHGPAINVHINTFDDGIIFLADFAFAIPCLKWPLESDWPFRNKMWPDHRVVTTIKDLGFHFVPVNQKNDKSKLTWRYSFSLAEKELSKQVNEIARKCFQCFKIISVDHLKPICKRLKSYHLKTILFHTLEVTSAEMWSEKNILNCLDYLLKELQEAFRQQQCRHFWISRINLFQDFKNRILSKLDAKVKEIRKSPVAFVGTYSLRIRETYQCFNKSEEVLSCFCFALVRNDCIFKDSIKMRNSMTEEAAPEEGNRERVSPEETALNIDSYPFRSYGSFSQK